MNQARAARGKIAHLWMSLSEQQYCYVFKALNKRVDI